MKADTTLCVTIAFDVNNTRKLSIVLISINHVRMYIVYQFVGFLFVLYNFKMAYLTSNVMVKFTGDPKNNVLLSHIYTTSKLNLKD